MDITLLLQDIGLTKSEASVYLACLEHGPIQPHEIADLTGFSRPSTYASIDSLAERGLLSAVSKGKRKQYAAEPADRLYHFALSRVRALESRAHEVQEAAKELEMRRRGERPVVKFYESVSGLKGILQDLIDTNAPHTEEFLNIDAVHNIFDDKELEEAQDILSKRRSTGRAIFAGHVSHIRKGVKAYILPGGSFDFDGDILIYGDKIAMVTYGGKIIGAVIESAALAKTMRAFFELAWKGAATVKGAALRTEEELQQERKSKK